MSGPGPPLRSHDIQGTHAEALAQIVAELKLVQEHLRTHVEPRLLTVEQAAAYIGRTKRGMEALVASHAIPTIRADNRVHLDRRDLDAWIERNRA